MMSEFALHMHAYIADLSRSKMNERGVRANVMKLLMKTLKTESVTDLIVVQAVLRIHCACLMQLDVC